jgi:hypothetical protein
VGDSVLLKAPRKALLHEMREDFAGAEPLHREALDIQIEAFGPENVQPGERADRLHAQRPGLGAA